MYNCIAQPQNQNVKNPTQIHVVAKRGSKHTATVDTGKHILNAKQRSVACFTSADVLTVPDSVSGILF